VTTETASSETRAARGTSGDAPKPSIVQIYVESMCYGDIAALGNDEVITPNLDRLVARGTAMMQTYNQGSFSGAVCIPSRGMLYTGRTLFSLRGNGRDAPPQHTLLGEHLGNCGYDTYHTGKWHMSRENYNRSHQDGATIHCFARGWYSASNGHWHDPIHDYDPTGEYGADTGYFASEPIEPFEQPFTIAEPRDGCKHSVELFTDSAVAFLRTRAGVDKPFYLDVPHITVHDPLQAPQRFLDMYRERPLSLYPNYAPEHAFDNGDLHVRDECLMPWPRTQSAVVRRKLELYATITHLDEQVGRIMDTLDELGLTDKTILIFTSDHGCSHGQHGLLGKQSLYDHAARVPLIMAGPGIRAGKVNQGLCYLLDIFPTLCELAELPVPHSVQGTSFAANLCDGKKTAREWLYLAYLATQRAVRDEDYKLLEYVVKGKRHRQLFKITEDRWEANDLIEDPAYAETRDRLVGLLEQARTLCDDTNPEHGAAYWSERATATPGTAPFSPLPEPSQHHRDLWRLIAENEHEVCIRQENA